MQVAPQSAFYTLYLSVFSLKWNGSGWAQKVIDDLCQPQLHQLTQASAKVG